MNEKIKQSWEARVLPFFSSVSSLAKKKSDVRAEELEIKKMLSEYHSTECKSMEAPATKTPPQAIQGMWQAYGQMRSARTRGRFGIAATGVIGLGLFGYRIILNDQRKEVKEKQSELESQKEKFDDLVFKKEEQLAIRERLAKEINEEANINMKKYAELLTSYALVNKQLEVAEAYIEKLCDNDVACISAYQRVWDYDKKSYDHGAANNAISVNKV